jgi:uncharacterized protein RhaS with RHS repeats
MKGRIYDPQLGRFLTPDPFVPSPTFSQSWNRYSYVLNNPLGYTDPSGFDEEPTATNPWVWKNVWWVPAINVPAPGHEKDKEKEKGDKQDGEETGLTVVPVDVQTAGNTAPSVSPPPSSGQERSTGALAGEIGIGVAQGVGEFAFESAKFLVLSALTFGGYGTYSLGVGVWDGYQEDGILGALNGANPLYPIAQAAADVSIAADNDDPRAAAAAVTKAALLTLTLVVGEEEVAAGAAKASGSGGTTKGGPKTLGHGPYAGESIPARGPARDFTRAERDAINRIGGDTGCHTCGSKSPGTKSGDFVPDHQPPSRLAPGEPQRLLPHCKSCSRLQGGEVNGELYRGQ